MNETAYSIDSADRLIAFLRTADSSVKIQKSGAEIILNNLFAHQAQLLADQDAKLYLRMKDKDTEETTIDDVVDIVCEYNYEEIYEAEELVKEESDFVSRCKMEKRLEKLKRDKRILDKIFYYTKYGRRVRAVADHICARLCEKFNLVPVYNVPMYEDRIVSEGTVYAAGIQEESADVKLAGHEENGGLPEEILGGGEIADGHIVTAGAVNPVKEPACDEKEETKGAR